MPKVEIAELRSMILARLASRFSGEDAERIADVVLFGELVGRPSHGVIRLFPGTYGVFDEEPGPTPAVVKRTQSSATVDGRPGMLVAAIATELVEFLAAESGFALVATRGSRSTSGSLTYFVEKLANAGLISFVTAGTLDFVSPPGLGERLLGTNPLAFGIPTEGRPFILDMATSAISGGDVLTAASEGAELPDGAAVDESGVPTTDPADVLGGGAVLAFGGHKGLGLSMFVEIVNKALTGATGDPGDWGHILVAFSPGLVDDEESVRRRATDELNRLSAAGARIPGHHSLRRRDEALERGWVEIDDESHRRLSDAVG